jgi:hypothetical protein
MMTRRNNQKGQSLAVALVGLMLAAACFTLLAQVGRLALERQRANNAADAVALGTAVDYARALNFISLTNKIYALTEIAEILKKIPYTMPFVMWVPPAKTMQRIQDYLAGTGNSLGCGSARISMAILAELGGMNLAQANNLNAVILWNGDDKEDPSLIPSLNLRRRYSDDGGAQTQSPGQDSGGDQGSQSAYSYRDHQTGQVIEVDSQYVQQESYVRRDGKTQTVYRYDHGKSSSRFVSKKEGQGKALDIAETGPHRVAIVGLRQAPEKGMPLLFVSAKAEAGGGSMALWDINAADYQAYLIPCSDSGGACQWDPSHWNLPKTGLEPLDAILQNLAGPSLQKLRGMAPSQWRMLH